MFGSIKEYKTLEITKKVLQNGKWSFGEFDNNLVKRSKCCFLFHQLGKQLRNLPVFRYDTDIFPGKMIAEQQNSVHFCHGTAAFLRKDTANLCLRISGKRDCHSISSHHKIRISGSNRMPLFSYTRSATTSRSVFTSDAVALPRFTTKPACF